MDNLHAQLNGKRLMTFSARQAGPLSELLRTFGASVVPTTTVSDALAMVVSRTIDSAMLDVEAAAEDLFSVSEALEARRIPFVFAIHTISPDLPPEFRGHVFPRNTEELRVVVNSLFGAPVIH